MYYFRLLERESGPSKFGAYAAITTGLAAALQWAAGRAGLGLPPGPSGPYGFIFACFVQYFFQVPASSKMVVLGWRFSDKVFLYLVGLQLLLSAGRASLVAGGAGLVAGLVYRFNLLGIKRLRFPSFVNRFFAATLGSLLGTDPPRAAAARSVAEGRPGATAAQGRGPGAAGAAAAAGGGVAGVWPGSGAAAAALSGGVAATAPHLPAPSRAAVEQLIAMGFGEAESIRALQLANNDVQQAIGLLLST